MFENFLSLMKKRTALFGLMVSFSYLPSPERASPGDKKQKKTKNNDTRRCALYAFQLQQFFLTWKDSPLLEPHKNSTSKVIEFM